MRVPISALAIEASNPSVRCACALRSMSAPGETLIEDLAPQGDDLMRCIDRLCARAGVEPNVLGHIAVSIGPGGFTSVRTSVTVSRMLAEATGARLVGVPTARVALHGRGREELVALASKGETAYVADVTGVGVVVDADGMNELLRQRGTRVLLADEHLPVSMRGVCHAAGVRIEPITLCPVACLDVSMGLAACDDPVALAPIYPREPEAVTKWRALHGPGGKARG